ncbi:MAG: HAD-IA family hydrolase [Haloferacaceae archaeon]
MCANVVTGEGEAAGFVSAVADELSAVLGFRPYPGTLNVDELPGLEALSAETLTDSPFSNEHCDGVVVRPCSVGGVRAAVLRPLVPDYPEGKIELIAPVRLRALFDLADGDSVPVSPPGEVWHPDGPAVDVAGLDEFDAVVFDLDGTLVELDVAWPEVHEQVVEILEDVMDGPLSDYTRPEIMGLAREVERYEQLDALLTEYETDGAETSPALGLLETLPELDCPIGVCTANAPSAAESALEAHGVREHVDVIVARGTIPEEKPHPRPLRECLAGLGVTPGNAVFVGDERSDAETAVSAASSFLHVEQF